MIDKQAILTKFEEVKKEHVLKVIELSANEFPKKLDLVIKNSEGLHYNEVYYYPRYIRESYAFVFHDVYLNRLCHKIEKAAGLKNRAEVMEHVKELHGYSKEFLVSLTEFAAELKNNVNN